MNSSAREFFTRHMRILEQCTQAWPMPEMQAQIDALRIAFSADTNRPFELKPSFPYGSPSEPYQSPPMEAQQPYHTGYSQESSTLGYVPHSITPPISSHTGALSHKSNSPDTKSMGLTPGGHSQIPTTMGSMPMVEGINWDPSRIIK